MTLWLCEMNNTVASLTDSPILTPGVREACCQFLEKQLDSTNCLGIKIFAERHGCDVLWAAADRFSVRHFEEVVMQEEFKSLPLDEVEALVKSDHLQVCGL